MSEEREDKDRKRKRTPPRKTRKTRKTTKKPTANQEIEAAAGVKRSRKAADSKTLGVVIYQREKDILAKALERQERLGSRATVSTCIRWAINTVDFDTMPANF